MEITNKFKFSYTELISFLKDYNGFIVGSNVLSHYNNDVRGSNCLDIIIPKYYKHNDNLDHLENYMNTKHIEDKIIDFFKRSSYKLSDHKYNTTDYHFGMEYYVHLPIRNAFCIFDFENINNPEIKVHLIVVFNDNYFEYAKNNYDLSIYFCWFNPFTENFECKFEELLMDKEFMSVRDFENCCDKDNICGVEYCENYKLNERIEKYKKMGYSYYANN
jgi:hypothetical protein